MLFVHQPDRTAFKITDSWYSRESGYLHILKSMVAKRRMPLLRSCPGYDIGILYRTLPQSITALCAGCLIHTASIRLQHLRRIHFHLSPLILPGIPKPEPYKTGAVFSHIHQPVPIGQRLHTFCRPMLPDTYGKKFLSGKLSFRRLHPHRIPPPGKISLRCIPSLKTLCLLPVKIFASVPILKGHRTFPDFPGLITHCSDFNGSVRSGKLYLG